MELFSEPKKYHDLQSSESKWYFLEQIDLKGNKVMIVDQNAQEQLRTKQCCKFYPAFSIHSVQTAVGKAIQVTHGSCLQKCSHQMRRQNPEMRQSKAVHTRYPVVHIKNRYHLWGTSWKRLHSTGVTDGGRRL